MSKAVLVAPQTPEMTPEALIETAHQTVPVVPETFLGTATSEAPRALELPKEPEAPPATDKVMISIEGVEAMETLPETEPEYEEEPESSPWPVQMWNARRLIKSIGGARLPEEEMFLIETTSIICKMMEQEPYECLPAAHDILTVMPNKLYLDRFLNLLAHMAANPQLVNDQPVLHVLARLLREIQKAWHVHFPVDTVSLALLEIVHPRLHADFGTARLLTA